MLVSLVAKQDIATKTIKLQEEHNKIAVFKMPDLLLTSVADGGYCSEHISEQAYCTVSKWMKTDNRCGTVCARCHGDLDRQEAQLCQTEVGHCRSDITGTLKNTLSHSDRL